MLTLLFLAFVTRILAQDPCSPTWQERRDNHQPTDLTADLESLRFFAEDLADDDDLDAHLAAILVERPVESQAHAEVRAHVEQTLRNLGWQVEEDAFTAETPIGDVNFFNIFAVLDATAPRRVVIGKVTKTLPKIQNFQLATMTRCRPLRASWAPWTRPCPAPSCSTWPPR